MEKMRSYLTVLSSIGAVVSFAFAASYYGTGTGLYLTVLGIVLSFLAAAVYTYDPTHWR